MMHKQDDNAQVLARLAALKAMSVKELKAEWDKLFETEAPNNSRSFLEQRLAYRIQELTLGGPSKPVRQLLDALADEVEGKKRSEEHTSELQSLMRISYAVFCLKKKKTTHTYYTDT